MPIVSTHFRSLWSYLLPVLKRVTYSLSGPTDQIHMPLDFSLTGSVITPVLCRETTSAATIRDEQFIKRVQKSCKRLIKVSLLNYTLHLLVSYV